MPLSPDFRLLSIRQSVQYFSTQLLLATATAVSRHSCHILSARSISKQRTLDGAEAICQLTIDQTALGSFFSFFLCRVPGSFCFWLTCLVIARGASRRATLSLPLSSYIACPRLIGSSARRTTIGNPPGIHYTSGPDPSKGSIVRFREPGVSPKREAWI